MTTEVTENRSEEPPATEESNKQKSKDNAEQTGTENGTATATASAAATAENENDGDEGEDTHDPFYPPIVSLPLVEVPTGENGEVEVFKRRAKLYR